MFSPMGTQSVDWRESQERQFGAGTQMISGVKYPVELFMTANRFTSTLLTRVVLSSTSIHTVGLTKTDSYALTITTLDRQTGALVSQSQILSQITRGMRDVFVLNTRDTKAPAVVWFEKHDGTLHSVVLDSNILSPEIASTKIRFAKVHDVQLDNEGLFVAETKDELPYVFGMYSTGLKQEWDFDDSVRRLRSCLS
ncbi:hypothetical protein AG1IA_08394 [Rhizoctonia solani AG-1 IA]|uniref:ER membrane protein complex subunit 1 n=1 Tax=Thanatephorus cucumeris (strain AG1-IA) TaxID=983506 RepID=L8WH83_THACA|nr:hypothetical protein AG1IA_08394 [Rhizoctonia solani AG-1 IA]